MRKFSETKQYIARTEKECMRLSDKTLDTAIRLVFDNGCYSPDEGLYRKRNRLRSSSYARGIIEYRKGQYVHMYYGTERKLGNLIEVIFEKPTPATEGE